ncbi:MAG: tetratricopeptide repeat protein [Polyangiaceae bacterium]|nr:tetratricopeptide repeat protein [Polyangiaceae bacterium]
MIATPAAAQPSASDRALATELFQQGRALMAEKKLDQACPKLEESMRLDPGGGTLLNLAICHEEQGKTATAWSEYAEAIALAQRDKRPDREKLAQDRSNALSPRLIRVVIEVPAASEVEGLVLTRNDAPVGRAAGGVPMPLDPGAYTIRASAPGRVEWTTSVELSEPGSRVVVTVPLLEQSAQPIEPAPEPPAEPPPAQPPIAQPIPPKAPAPVTTNGSETFYVAAAAVGGVGAVGIILGGVFGGLASSRKGDLDDVCEGDVEKICPTGSSADIDEMKTLAKASTGSFVAGGVVLSAAAVLLTIGIVEDNESHLSVAVGSEGLIFRGTFR